MKNPCVKDCPGRAPGCCCEKRKAWLEERELANKARRKQVDINGYQHDAASRIRRKYWKDGNKR